METVKTLSTRELQGKWVEYFKYPPPRGASKEYLHANIAWQAQAKQHGGLGRKAKGQIKQLMQQLRDGVDLNPENSLTLKPGSRLLREYKGSKHEVIVAEGGYQYQDKMYRSLSQIARLITGTRWNGKLFFGVKK